MSSDEKIELKEIAKEQSENVDQTTSTFINPADDLTSSLNPYASLVRPVESTLTSQENDSTLVEANTTSNVAVATATIANPDLSSVDTGDLAAETNSIKRTSENQSISRNRARTNSIKYFTEKALHGVQRFSNDILRSIENAHELVDLKNSNFSTATQTAAAQLYSTNYAGGTNKSTRHTTRTKSMNIDDVLEENESAGEQTHDSTSRDRGSVIGSGYPSNRCSECLKEDAENEEKEALDTLVETPKERDELIASVDEIRNEEITLTNQPKNTTSGSVSSLNKRDFVVHEDDKSNPNPVKLRTGSLFRGLSNCFNFNKLIHFI
jgi:hypothetical protein